MTDAAQATTLGGDMSTIAGASLSRRAALGAGLASGVALSFPAAAEIQGLEIIAPAGPGGGYDQLARATQEVFQSRKLASRVQVTNVPGAGGTIGLAQLVGSRKRNPTIMVAGLGMVGAVLTNKSPVTLDQATPLARLTGEYQPLVVGAESPLRTLAELLDKFRADPGSVSWGGFALGSPDHILSGLIVKAAGGDVAKMNYIVAGAGGEMLAQVIGNHITVATGGYNEFAQQIAAGKLRPLGISSPERLPGVDVPTFKEQGVDVTLVNWRGFMASASLGAEDKKALGAAMADMAASPEWQAIVKQRGWVDLYLPPDEFATFLAEEQGRIATILKDTGLIQ
jgi:putative tricarboxylic transport membrane protein